MMLERVPGNSGVFLDANLFIYHFTGVSQQCTALLNRCESGQVRGSTGVHVLIEVGHRLMTIEAVRKNLLPPGNVAAKLRSKPEVVRKLTDYQTNLEAILTIGLQVFALTVDDLVASAALRRNAGLLFNDSLTAAITERERIGAIATSDTDFRRVPNLRVYLPTDLPWPSR